MSNNSENIDLTNYSDQLKRNCCDNKILRVVDGCIAGQGSPVRMQHITCVSCGQKTTDSTWWYMADGFDVVADLAGKWKRG